MIDKTTQKKIILDACCGGRWFWFNKNHSNTLYIDNRRCEKGHDKYRKNHSVEPDVIMDFRKMDFPDKKFKLVVFDPPHMKTLGKNSKFARYYGCLNAETWQTDLREGFKECWRVLDDFGVLIFKWNESEISLKDILKLFPQEPLFGHPTNSKNTTHWCCFMKIPIANPSTSPNGDFATQKSLIGIKRQSNDCPNLSKAQTSPNPNIMFNLRGRLVSYEKLL